jgi:hypothetical protein
VAAPVNGNVQLVTAELPPDSLLLIGPLPIGPLLIGPRPLIGADLDRSLAAHGLPFGIWIGPQAGGRPILSGRPIAALLVPESAAGSARRIRSAERQPPPKQ